MKTVGSAEHRGFSLIELGIVLVVVMTLAGLMQPKLAELYAKHRIQTQASALLSFFQSVKMLSMQQHNYLTVCPTIDKLHCSRDWSKPLMAFVDENRNSQIDDSDEIMLTQEATPSLVANRRVLHFSPLFNAANTAATLKLCGEKVSLRRAIIISNMGRVRQEQSLSKISC